MQTQLADFIKQTPQGTEADAILRRCVHCGFCTATCPTYQLLGDELDSPRGRIYLIKQMVEGKQPSAKTQTHLDRCLTCRNCETTCPSGVQYGRLLEIGRQLVEQQVPRSLNERLMRQSLRSVLPYSSRFKPLLALGQLTRPLLPASLKHNIPARHSVPNWPKPRHQRHMLVLQGCVQPGLAPHFNAITAQILDRLGISLLAKNKAGCCGAVSYHLGAEEEGKDFMRANIDAWWPAITAGAEAIVMTASGCGALVKEYGHILRDDPQYAEKAAKISALTRDLSEILAAESLTALGQPGANHPPIAFHAPCTLQHGQKLPGQVEQILQRLGFTLTPVADAHLCCGSAGTYSILQKDLSQQLLNNKVKALEAGQPACIATANIGCWSHLSTSASVPVKHWIELLL